mgnify:FL=1
MNWIVSVYGVMDMSVAEDTPYNWDYSLYQMEEEQKGLYHEPPVPF